MEKYSIRFKKSAVKELQALPKSILHRIIHRINDLGGEPRPSGAKKLAPSEFYRIRQGDYRIIYRILDDDRLVEIYKIGHRRDIYRH